jgi:hypothetical protein
MLIRCVLLLQGAGMYVYKTIIAFVHTFKSMFNSVYISDMNIMAICTTCILSD